MSIETEKNTTLPETFFLDDEVQLDIVECLSVILGRTKALASLLSLGGKEASEVTASNVAWQIEGNIVMMEKLFQEITTENFNLRKACEIKN